MKRLLPPVLALVLFCNVATAQTKSEKKQLATAKRFVAAYNKQDFKAMKRQFILIARVFPLKKMMKQVFEPHHAQNGGVTIDSVQRKSPTRLIAHVKYASGATDGFSFVMNKKGKLQGLNLVSPDMKYPAGTSPAGFAAYAAKTRRIDSIVTAGVKSGFNGAVLVTTAEGDVYKTSRGLANRQTGELLNDSSLFELASCSKQFTGMAIMILAEKGRLGYTDTIQKFIPDFPYRGITVEHLLRHTSGLPDYMSLLEKKWDRKKFATNADLVAMMTRHKPKVYFKPGERFSYSNTGYALLSVIIEKASGQSYADFLSANIFRPLNMTRTRVYNTRRSGSEKITNYAYGYVYSTESHAETLPDSLKDYEYVKYMDAITGDGTVNSTIIDLAKWEQALRTNKLVKPETMARAYSTSQTLKGKECRYGFGHFIVNDTTCRPVAWHSGGWPGYSTVIVRFQDEPLSVVVLSNNESQRTMRIADDIIRTLITN